MSRYIVGILLLSLGCQAVAMAGVALAAPVFSLFVGPLDGAVEVAAIGALLMAIGWVVLPATKISRTLPILLIAFSWGMGLSWGPLRGNAWSELTLRNWLAVVTGIGVVGAAFGFVYWRQRRSSNLIPTEEVLERLVGDHFYDSRARLGNWVLLWLFITGPMLVVGIVEAQYRGWDSLRWTAAMASAAVLGLACGVLSIKTLNRTRYVVQSEFIEECSGWPHRSWKLHREEIAGVTLETIHGHWRIVFQLRNGGKKVVPATATMREKLELP